MICKKFKIIYESFSLATRRPHSLIMNSHRIQLDHITKAQKKPFSFLSYILISTATDLIDRTHVPTLSKQFSFFLIKSHFLCWLVHVHIYRYTSIHVPLRQLRPFHTIDPWTFCTFKIYRISSFLSCFGASTIAACVYSSFNSYHIRFSHSGLSLPTVQASK